MRAAGVRSPDSLALALEDDVGQGAHEITELSIEEAFADEANAQALQRIKTFSAVNPKGLDPIMMMAQVKISNAILMEILQTGAKTVREFMDFLVKAICIGIRGEIGEQDVIVLHTLADMTHKAVERNIILPNNRFSLLLAEIQTTAQELLHQLFSMMFQIMHAIASMTAAQIPRAPKILMDVALDSKADVAGHEVLGSLVLEGTSYDEVLAAWVHECESVANIVDGIKDLEAEQKLKDGISSLEAMDEAGLRTVGDSLGLPSLQADTMSALPASAPTPVRKQEMRERIAKTMTDKSADDLAGIRLKGRMVEDVVERAKKRLDPGEAASDVVEDGAVQPAAPLAHRSLPQLMASIALGEGNSTLLNEYNVALAVESYITRFCLEQQPISPGMDQIKVHTNIQKGGKEVCKGMSFMGDVEDAKLYYMGNVIGETRANYTSRHLLMPLGSDRQLPLYLDGSKFLDVESSLFCLSWFVRALPKEKEEKPVPEVEAREGEKKAKKKRRISIPAEPEEPAFLIAYHDFEVIVPKNGKDFSYRYRLPFLDLAPGKGEHVPDKVLFRERIALDDAVRVENKKAMKSKTSALRKFMTQ